MIITKAGHLKRFIENQVQTIQDGEDEEEGRHGTFFVQNQTHVGVQGLMSCCLCVAVMSTLFNVQTVSGEQRLALSAEGAHTCLNRLTCFSLNL